MVDEKYSPYLETEHFKSVIIVDLDGTLSNNDHRVHLAQEKKWEEFHEGISFDLPVDPVATMISEFSGIGYEIIAVTGRPEKYRSATEQWLADFDINIDEVLMRPHDNWESDHELKIKIAAEYFGEHAKDIVLLVIDDRDRVVEAWRENGYFCLQPQNGDY